MKGLVLNGRHFPTKEACRTFFSNMLRRYKPGDEVGFHDYSFLLDLLDMHTEAEKKVGCGVRGFKVVQDPVWKKNRHFLIVRVDGSTEDFSYVHCISKPKNAHKSDVLEAMRSDIFKQVRDFKHEAYSGRKYVRCCITGLNVRMSDCHVDHAPPQSFQRLAFDFLRSESLTLADVEVLDVYGSSRVTPLTLKDEQLRARWQEFHRKHAVLRITLDHANLGQKKDKVDFSELNSLQDASPH